MFHLLFHVYLKPLYFIIFPYSEDTFTRIKNMKHKYILASSCKYQFLQSANFLQCYIIHLWVIKSCTQIFNFDAQIILFKHHNYFIKLPSFVIQITWSCIIIYYIFFLTQLFVLQLIIISLRNVTDLQLQIMM